MVKSGIISVFIFVLLTGPLNAQLILDREVVEVELEAGEQLEIAVNISNEGDDAIDWQILWMDNPDAWELVRSINVGEIVGDDRIEGVAYANGRFYVSGDGNDEPQVYILNHDAELVDQFDQPVQDYRRGFQDLTFDGESLWGSIGDVIYRLDFDGQVDRSFEGPYNPISGIAYDPVEDLIWVCGVTTDMMALALDGDQVTSIDRQGLRTYGLAYLPVDRDSSGLYAITRDRDNNSMSLYKFNTETGDMTFVEVLNRGGDGTPGGAFITDDYMGLNWVYMCVVSVSPRDGGDRIDIWNIIGDAQWITINPLGGVLESHNDSDIFLSFDATGLEPQLYEEELIVRQVGDEDDIILPIRMTVFERIEIPDPIDDMVVDEDPGPVEITDLDDVFEDPDGAELNFRVINAREELNMNIDNANVLFFDPVENFNLPRGTNVIIMAENPDGRQARDVFNLTINPVNDAPVVLRSIEDITIEQDPGLVYVADLTEIFGDVDGDVLTYTIINAPVEINMAVSDENDLHFEPEPDFVLPEGVEITITAEDAAEESVEDSFTLIIDPLVIQENDFDYPEEYSLISVCPNPFNASTTITCTLPVQSSVALQVYNTRGQLVDVLLDRVMPAGRHSLVWDGNGMSTGVYLVRMDAEEGCFRKTVKVVLTK